MTDVIHLNVGGEVMMTTRRSLTLVSSSLLAKLFNGRWEKTLCRDDDGLIFLDFNPQLFRYLLEQLRQYKTNLNSVFARPPTDFSSLSTVESYDKMLKRLGIHPAQSSADEIVLMNVAGDRLITRKKTLISRSFTKNNGLFVDADPSLFRTLIGQLRIQKAGTNLLQFEIASSDKIKAINRMLKSFEPKRMSFRLRTDSLRFLLDYAQVTGSSRWTSK